MKTRALGTTGLELTELSFGCAEIGNLYRATSNIETFTAVSAAWDAGIRSFDTAPLYGYGLSERRIGDALRSRSPEYILSTHVGRVLIPDATPKHHDIFPASLPFHAVFDYSYEGIMRSLEDSLQRIGLDHVDILYVHDLDKTTHGGTYKEVFKTFVENGYRALEDLRSNKIIKAIGLCVNEWQACMDVMPHTDMDCFMLDGQYTLLEQESLKTFFPECQRRSISVIAASPYNTGVLTHSQFNGFVEVDEATRAHVEKLKKVCDNYQIDLQHAAIQFPLLNPQVVSLVVGVRTQEQIITTMNYLRNPIAADFWQELKSQGLIAEDAPGTEVLSS